MHNINTKKCACERLLVGFLTILEDINTEAVGLYNKNQRQPCQQWLLLARVGPQLISSISPGVTGKGFEYNPF